MNILLIIHILITLALIGVILIQRSEGGGLAGMGGSNPTGGLFSARGAANLLTRATGILATLFFVNCLLMGALSKNQISRTSSILDTTVPTTPSVPEESNKK